MKNFIFQYKWVSWMLLTLIVICPLYFGISYYLVSEKLVGEGNIILPFQILFLLASTIIGLFLFWINILRYKVKMTRKKYAFWDHLLSVISIALPLTYLLFGSLPLIISSWVTGYWIKDEECPSVIKDFPYKKTAILLVVFEITKSIVPFLLFVGLTATGNMPESTVEIETLE